MINSIQTNYAGCLFRSRLEARWAVFFDTAKIKWEYEPEGFKIKDGFSDAPDSQVWMYLPDFFLTDYKTWVEVKGDIKEIPEDYLYMLQWATDWNGQLPYTCNNYGTSSGLLILSNIPQPNGIEVCHPIFHHGKGGYLNLFIFKEKNVEVHTNDESYFDATWGDKSCIRKWLLDIDCYQGKEAQDEKIKKAYLKARKARFEYGAT